MSRNLNNLTLRQTFSRGFTLLELVAAITIIGLLLAVAIPASARFYESIQYRQAVRDVVTTLASARYQAVNTGRTQDVQIDPFQRRIGLNGKVTRLPNNLAIEVYAAGELNRGNVGVIRFYPEGGSTGGGIDLERQDGSGVRVSVDWLLGRVSQEAYVSN
ncbi:MAG: GspH/FimT family pseudopilin [Pseudomonadota bacterium]